MATSPRANVLHVRPSRTSFTYILRLGILPRIIDESSADHGKTSSLDLIHGLEEQRIQLSSFLELHYRNFEQISHGKAAWHGMRREPRATDASFAVVIEADEFTPCVCHEDVEDCDRRHGQEQ